MLFLNVPVARNVEKLQVLQTMNHKVQRNVFSTIWAKAYREF